MLLYVEICENLYSLCTSVICLCEWSLKALDLVLVGNEEMDACQKFLLSVLGTVSDKQPSLTVTPFAECRVLILFSRLFHHFQRTKFCGVRYVDLICSLDALMYVLHLLPRPSGVRFWICILHLNQIFVLKVLFYATAINSCTMSSTTTIDQYCSVVCNSSGF